MKCNHLPIVPGHFLDSIQGTKQVCLIFRVLSTGGGGGGGEILPQTLQLPPQNFCLTKSYNVLAKNLSAISQLQGPRNYLRMPQNHSQKAQNSKKFWGGMPPDPPRELRPMPATPIHCHFQHLPPQNKNPR